MSFIERQCRKIVDRRFQADGMGSGSNQALLGRAQQHRSDAGSPCCWSYIDRDDVTGSCGVRYDEPNGFTSWLLGPHQREGSTAADVSAQFRLRIRNPCREAFLVHPPKGFKILGTELPYDGHRAIVPILRRTAVKPCAVAPSGNQFRTRFPQLSVHNLSERAELLFLSSCSSRNLRRTMSIRESERRRRGGTPSSH